MPSPEMLSFGQTLILPTAPSGTISHVGFGKLSGPAAIESSMRDAEWGILLLIFQGLAIV